MLLDIQPKDYSKDFSDFLELRLECKAQSPISEEKLMTF